MMKAPFLLIGNSRLTWGFPRPAKQVHIRLDAEVLRWFKSRGPGYQTRINAVLRAFVQTRRRAEDSQPEPK